MKNLIMTTIIALGVAAPTLSSAMEKESLHSEKALKIFEQLAAESRGTNN